MGFGSGMLLTVAGQKLLNQHYQETCPSKPTHQLVFITSFIGAFAALLGYTIPAVRNIETILPDYAPVAQSEAMAEGVKG